MLAEDQQMADWVATSSDELWQAASQTVNAMVKHPGSQEPNETLWFSKRLVTGFALANRTDKSVFETLSQNPPRARRFGNAMKA
ncbi:hypothetical protein ACMFMF_005634 [Clarireedia jacksonii]